MAALDGLPPLREVIAKHGLDALKALGQNFLLDLNITQKVARTAGKIDDAVVVEIGPGPGGLTRALLALDAKRVIAIERDRRAIPALEEIGAHYPGRLTIIEGDALEIDLAQFKTEGVPLKVVANLPYNIGTQLLVNWLTVPWPPFWDSLTLMFQKEVGERIVAEADDDHYGRLGVLCGWLTHANMMFDLSPQAFTPPPKVTSTVVHLKPREKPIDCDLGKLERVTAAAFGQRRKMLRQSVKSLGGEVLLQKAGIDASRRAETLSVAEFCRIANLLA
jgi:16S rRNA (adenine1518-N6/adenine1519-N6)-dimethyltransferase